MELPIFSKLITLLWLVSCVTGLQADFVSLSIWERTTTAGEKQHLVCLGDLHNLSSQANEQSDDLINWLKQRNNAHDIVLIEDTVDVTYIVDQARAYLKEHNKTWDDSCLQNVQARYDNEIRQLTYTPKDDSLLARIGQKLAYHKSIRSHNVDFRLLNEASAFICLSQEWKLFLRNELHDFVTRKIMEEIQGYNDCKFLNSYYQQCVKPLFSILKESGSISKQNIVKLLTDHNGKSKIFDFLPHQDSYYYKFDYREYSVKYDLHDRNKLAADLLCELMDARMLHHIYQEHIQKDQANVIVVCAGAAHVWNVEAKLDKLGYARIYQDGASSVNDLIRRGGLSKKLSYWLNALSQRPLFLQRFEQIVELVERIEIELEERKRIELEERIKRRIKHMFLDFDTDMTYAQHSPPKQQSKL